MWRPIAPRAARVEVEAQALAARHLERALRRPEDLEEFAEGMRVRYGIGVPDPTVAWKLLLGSYRGLFYLSPVLMLATWGVGHALLRPAPIKAATEAATETKTKTVSKPRIWRSTDPIFYGISSSESPQLRVVGGSVTQSDRVFRETGCW